MIAAIVTAAMTGSISKPGVFFSALFPPVVVPLFVFSGFPSDVFPLEVTEEGTFEFGAQSSQYSRVVAPGPGWAYWVTVPHTSTIVAA